MIHWQESKEGGFELKSPFGRFYLSSGFVDENQVLSYTCRFYGSDSAFPAISENFLAMNDYHAKERAVRTFHRWVNSFNLLLGITTQKMNEENQ